MKNQTEALKDILSTGERYSMGSLITGVAERTGTAPKRSSLQVRISNLRRLQGYRIVSERETDDTYYSLKGAKGRRRNSRKAAA